MKRQMGFSREEVAIRREVTKGLEGKPYRGGDWLDDMARILAILDREREVFHRYMKHLLGRAGDLRQEGARLEGQWQEGRAAAEGPQGGRMTWRVVFQHHTRPRRCLVFVRSDDEVTARQEADRMLSGLHGADNARDWSFVKAEYFDEANAPGQSPPDAPRIVFKDY